MRTTKIRITGKLSYRGIFKMGRYLEINPILVRGDLVDNYSFHFHVGSIIDGDQVNVNIIDGKDLLDGGQAIKYDSLVHGSRVHGNTTNNGNGDSDGYS